jgi:hypothetical protein
MLGEGSFDSAERLASEPSCFAQDDRTNLRIAIDDLSSINDQNLKCIDPSLGKVRLAQDDRRGSYELRAVSHQMRTPGVRDDRVLQVAETKKQLRSQFSASFLLNIMTVGMPW